MNVKSKCFKRSLFHIHHMEKKKTQDIFFKGEPKISALMRFELSPTNPSNLGKPPSTLVIFCTEDFFFKWEFVLCWCHTLQYTSVAHEALYLQEKPRLKLCTSAVSKVLHLQWGCKGLQHLLFVLLSLKLKLEIAWIALHLSIIFLPLPELLSDSSHVIYCSWSSDLKGFLTPSPDFILPLLHPTCLEKHANLFQDI